MSLMNCTTACRGLFATHYHKLADAHACDPTTSIRHMACHVDSDAAGREQVHHSFQILDPLCLCMQHCRGLQGIKEHLHGWSMVVAWPHVHPKRDHDGNSFGPIISSTGPSAQWRVFTA